MRRRLMWLRARVAWLLARVWPRAGLFGVRSWDLLRCEVCGAPATTFCRDVYETGQAPDGGVIRRVGMAHFYCREHERDTWGDNEAGS